MAGSQSGVRVFKALESTESLLTSLLDRSSLSPTEVETTDSKDGVSLASNIDVEQSLLGTGELSRPPGTFAFSYARERDELGGDTEAIADPRDTLNSIVCRSSVRGSISITVSLEEQLYQKEKELEVTAKLGLGLLERKELLEKEVTRLTEQSRNLEQMLSQARHELGMKESLLQLYYTQEAQNETTAQFENQTLSNQQMSVSTSEWVKALNKESEQLKEENKRLWSEKQELEQDAQKNVQMSQALVKQCVDQLSEAKQELMEVQSQMERQSKEDASNKEKLRQAVEENVSLNKEKKQAEEDLDETRERLGEALLESSHLTAEVAEWTDKYETCYIMLQSAKEEVKILKDLADNNRSGVHTPSSEPEHGSIVSEIEAVLRHEILAASTLDERPLSPSTYAKQRTMVVMETVKAATLATAKKLENLAEQQRKRNSELLHPVPVDPNDPNQKITYVSPQKLQIVKPMEGSATLLQWKILATPKLGGTASFFSKSDRPGIKQRNLESPPPPTTPTPSSLGRREFALMNEHGLHGNKRWSSTSDLARNKVSSTPHITINGDDRRDGVAGSRKKQASSRIENNTSDLSTVGKVRQNIWGLFSPSGKTSGNKKENKNKSNHQQKGAGLEELLV